MSGIFGGFFKKQTSEQQHDSDEEAYEEQLRAFETAKQLLLQNKILEEMKAKEQDNGLVKVHAPILPVKDQHVLDKLLEDKEI